MVDEVAIPDGLEQSIGEAECEDVLRRFLAEEVVDTEDLLLVEHFVKLGVEFLRAREVRAERLLHDDARVLDQSRFAERAHHGQRCVGRHRQVVQAAALDADGPLGTRYGVGQRRRPGRERHIVEAFGKAFPVDVGDLARGFVERGTHELAKAVGVERVE